MVDERAFVIQSFRKNFESIKGEPLAIYGLGKNTPAILEECQDYNIVALMDRLPANEKRWGLPIMTVEEVYEIGVRNIIIVATSANTPIIFRRIRGACEEKNINVYDVNGERKEYTSEEYNLPSFYKTNIREILEEKIAQSDVISFDIFDTLLVRDCLYPTDVFERVSIRFSEKFPLGHTFSQTRIKAEQELYAEGKNPNIDEIYNKISESDVISQEIIEEIKQEEIAEEHAVLHRREIMYEIAKSAHDSGKRICATSDMYLPKDILVGILEKEGFGFLDEIFVSCEYGKPKTGGLFEEVKKRYKGKRILHIGDNFDADIVAAEKSGIDNTFQIASIYKMVSDSRVGDIIDTGSSLDDRYEKGFIFSNLMNDPFLFEKTEGHLYIDNNYTLGYYIFEPILATFIEWMLVVAEENKLNTIALGSRDGWLIQRLLDIRLEKEPDRFRYPYIYTSRYACTLAGLMDKEDVLYAFSMAFDGAPEEMLRSRFGLKSDEISDRNIEETDEEYLARHIDIILSNAERNRERYRKYLSKVLPKDKKDIAFFDFVSSGTCQLWLEKIWPEARWSGVYFLRALDAYKERLRIHSFFKPKYAYEKQSKLSKNYIFMENVMTSYEPTLMDFTEEGKPIFCDEVRNPSEIKYLKEIHSGIMDAYMRRCGRGEFNISRELTDAILDTSNEKYSVMKAAFFENNYLIDDFSKRKFDLRKMLSET